MTKEGLLSVGHWVSFGCLENPLALAALGYFRWRWGRKDLFLAWKEVGRLNADVVVNILTSWAVEIDERVYGSMYNVLGFLSPDWIEAVSVIVLEKKTWLHGLEQC